jgi:CrcB protein
VTARPPPALPALVGVVALGGALGALARLALAVTLPAAPGALPAATLLTNLSGCLALGLLVGARPEAPWLRPFLATGVLGGFTTFSAFALETDRLLVTSPATALAYVALSTAGGLALAAAGLRWARR